MSAPNAAAAADRTLWAPVFRERADIEFEEALDRLPISMRRAAPLPRGDGGAPLDVVRNALPRLCRLRPSEREALVSFPDRRAKSHRHVYLTNPVREEKLEQAPIRLLSARKKAEQTVGVPAGGIDE